MTAEWSQPQAAIAKSPSAHKQKHQQAAKREFWKKKRSFQEGDVQNLSSPYVSKKRPVEPSSDEVAVRVRPRITTEQNMTTQEQKFARNQTQVKPKSAAPVQRTIPKATPAPAADRVVAAPAPQTNSGHRVTPTAVVEQPKRKENANLTPLGATKRIGGPSRSTHQYPYFRDVDAAEQPTTNIVLPPTDVFSEMSFADMKLDERLVAALKDGALRAETLTKTQYAAFPSLFQGRDVMLRAETGSGKTLAFAVPIVQQLCTAPVTRDQGTLVAPTRELALQIYDVFKAILKPFHWIVPGAVIGGEKRKSVNILIATPGRLLDHMRSTKSFSMQHVRWLVLDEADRLLDMGFEKDISAILAAIKEKSQDSRKQIVLTSATLHDRVLYVSQTNMTKPVYVGFDKDMMKAYEEVRRLEWCQAVNNVQEELADLPLFEEGTAFTTPKQLQHWFCIVSTKRRLVALTAFLRWKTTQKEECKIIVFLSSQDSVEFHYAMLTGVTMQPPSESKRVVVFDEDGETHVEGTEEEEQEDTSEHLLPTPVFRLHGGMRQEDRTQQFFQFAQTPTGVLLCTDVAARGLDLPAVEWIVQYDTPGVPTEYIHRAGRTARLGHAGNAILFLAPNEAPYLDILRNIGVDLKEMAADDVLLTVMKDTQHGQSREWAIQEGVRNVQQLFQHYVNTHLEVHDMAMKAYQAALRAYATHSADTKHIFHVKKLHLGHFAKSFALEDPPMSVSKQLRKKHELAEKEHKVKERERQQKQEWNYLSKPQTVHKAILSEFM